ncbi:hypothetical protein J437_LFUL002152, partial [Ladona fulva]
MAHEFLPLCDVLFNIISLASYFCDVVFDVVMVYALFEQQQFSWVVVCLVFIISSLIICQIVSLRWYFGTPSCREEVDGQGDSEKYKEKVSLWQKNYCKKRSLPIFITHVILCGVLWRYFKLFMPVDPRRVKHEVRELCVLRLIHAFAEAAPMLLLQLHLIWTEVAPKELSDLTLVSTALSLFSVCWALASFGKNAARPRYIGRLVLTWPGVVSQFLWRLGTVGSRAVCLAAYAAAYGRWVLLVLGLHWVSMFLWLVSPRSAFHGEGFSRPRRAALSALLALVHVLCYVNLREESPRCRMAAFYIIMFLENALLVTAWLVGSRQTKDDVTLRTTIPCISLALFGSGMLFLFLYYRYFHVRRLQYAYDQQRPDGFTTGGSIGEGDDGLTGVEGSTDLQGNHTREGNGVRSCGKQFQGKTGSGMNGHCVGISSSNGGLPYAPGVFNCRFNPATKRKKKKPTTFVPPPAPVPPSTRQPETVAPLPPPFWKTPLPPATGMVGVAGGGGSSVAGGSSENDGSSVGSRVDIRQKLREKREQQLAELRLIEEEMEQGKLQRRPAHPGCSGGAADGVALPRQPIPRAKRQPWPRPCPPHLPYVVPPPRKQRRSNTPEILLAPRYLDGGSGGVGNSALQPSSRIYYHRHGDKEDDDEEEMGLRDDEDVEEEEDDEEDEEEDVGAALDWVCTHSDEFSGSNRSGHCGPRVGGGVSGDRGGEGGGSGDGVCVAVSGKRERRRCRGGEECRDKAMYKSYRIPSDIDSQISLPRSYTLPREFKYYRRPKSRKAIRSEHF